jgi:NADP-dependent 3-hydroxy acid dehydrogenase YdfG
VIDAGVDTAWVRERIRERGDAAAERLEPGRLVNPASIAEAYWVLHQQPRDAWTHELDIRPSREAW